MIQSVQSSDSIEFSPPAADTTPTLMLSCPVCGCDIGEPFGVTGPFSGEPDGTVVVRCADCAAVYLSPDRAPLGTRAPRQLPESLIRAIVSRCDGGLPDNPKLLICNADADTVAPANADDEAGRFDLIVVPLTLESERDPGAYLRRLRTRLAAAGRIAVVGNNGDSSCFAVFGGRHFSGYAFPRTRQIFSARSLRALAQETGFREVSSSTAPSIDAWLTSSRNWLCDWGMTDAAARILAGRWPLPWAIAWLLERFATLRRRGAILITVLERHDR